MRQTRNDAFFAQHLTDDEVLEKIKRELGQGDWKIEWSRTGSMVKWLAVLETKPQGPR